MQAYAPAAFAFETERLLLRPLQVGDEALFCGLYTDAEAMRYIGDPLTQERAERNFRKAVASWNDDPLKRVFLTVLEKANQQPLGICAIVQFEANTSRAEVGIMLKSDAYGRGYAREGLGALVRQAFSRFPVTEIWVECSAKNPVVERMVTSIGFVLRNGTSGGDGPLAQRVWSARRAS
jgi:RimJ/RimL family protein N-acetyltransferase